MSDQLDISTVPIQIRTQLLRNAYRRLVNLLAIYSEGYLLIPSESLDEAYIRLLQVCKDMLETTGFEKWRVSFPEELPETLFSLGEEADIDWEYLKPRLMVFIGKINQMAVEIGAQHDSELEDIFFKGYDSFIDTYRKTKQQQEKKFFDQVENRAGNQLKPQQELLPSAIVKGTRKYIEQVILQANGCYSQCWYDACAVMIRRIIETLLIECFESHKIDDKIKGPDGNFLPLEILIDRFLNESTWNLGRDTKRSLSKLPKFKGIGDHSAHNRRFLAQKDDIDKVADELRVTIQELVTIAFDRQERPTPASS